MSSSTLAAALAEAHGPALRAWFRRATGRSDVAEDLAQEVFLRVVRFAGGYQARGRDRAWLFAIAHRVLVDHFRGVTRPGAVPGAPVGVDVDAAAGGAAAPMQEVRVILQRALALLDATDRDAFLMAEVAGLSYAEIAIVLQMSHAAVRSRVHRARLALRAGLLTPAAASPRKGSPP